MTLLLAIGCRPLQTLDEVAIVGGTDAQVDIVRAELLAFDDAVGPGRVALRKVAIRDGREVDIDGQTALLGKYHVWSDTIVLAGQFDDPAVLSGMLRHELCHALDHQEGLSATAPPIWPPLAEVSPEHLALRPGKYDEPDQEVREVFATLCGEGAEAMVVWSRSCSADPYAAGSAAEWIAEEVYGGRSAWVGDWWLVADGPTHELSDWPTVERGPPDQLEVLTTLVLGRPAFRFTLREGDYVQLTEVLDAETGAVVPVGVEAPASVVASAFQDEPGRTAQVGAAVLRDLVGDPEGPAVGRFTTGSFTRWAATADGRAWAPIESCPSWVRRFATVDGRLWAIWVELPATVGWGEITR